MRRPTRRRSVWLFLLGLGVVTSFLAPSGQAGAASMVFDWRTPRQHPLYPWITLYDGGQSSVRRSASASYSGYCPGCGLDGEDEYYNVGDRAESELVVGSWSGSASSNGVRATHESTITADRIDFAGTANSGYGDNSAASSLRITFRVDEREDWTFVRNLALEGAVSVRLHANDEEIYRGGTWSGNDVRPLFTLVPEVDYELFISVSDFGGSGYTQEGGIVWFPIPEPGTGLMVGFGLLGLAARRR